MNNRSDTPLISEFLTRLKSALLTGSVKPSDAALAATRVGRLFFTDTHLAAMSRELLGYSDEQAGAEIEVIRMISNSTEIHSPLKSLAKHRMLHGYRMPLFVALKQAKERSRPRVNKEDWFCPLSAGEIEELLEQVANAQAPYVVLDWNDGENGVFICSSRNLRQMHEGMRELLVWSIDLLIKQLGNGNLPGHNVDSNESKETKTNKPERAA